MRFDLETRYNYYDVAGHVNNAVYLTYFEVARVKAWSAMVGARQDVAFVIAEASVRYVSRAQLGEPLAIDIRTAEVRDKAHPEAPEGWTLTVSRRGAGRSVREYPPAAAVRANLEAWAGAAAGGPAYPMTADEMLGTVAALEAVVRSAASGAVETVAAPPPR